MKVAIAIASVALVSSAGAQRAVPAASEPHHHLSYADSLVRVLRVEVPPRDRTLLHEHAVDYFWVGVGTVEVINAVAGQPEAKVNSVDGAVHFTRGGFAHVARNEGGVPFFNVTIELLRPQTNPQNLCEQVVASVPANCASAISRTGLNFSGTDVHPAFETDQLRVTLITLTPNSVLQIERHAEPPLLVNVDDTDGDVTLKCELMGAPRSIPIGSRSGDVTTFDPLTPCAIRNPGQGRVRVLALEFKRPRR